jgi:hypothetical protein
MMLLHYSKRIKPRVERFKTNKSAAKEAFLKIDGQRGFENKTPAVCRNGSILNEIFF